MSFLSICWLLLIFPVASLGQLSPIAAPDIGFDCRRNLVTCSNGGTCDLSTGNCDCSSNATNFNYMCQDITASGTCTPACENDGVCVNSVCVCGENYYGTSCEMERVLVACEADQMFINVFPSENFSGLIYVKGFDSTVDCQLGYETGDPGFGEPDKITNAANLLGWRRVFLHDGGQCGNITSQEKTDAATGAAYTSFTRKFFVQYNQNFKSSVDQIITAECKVANGTATVYSDVNTITDDDGNYGEVNADDDVDTVTLEVQNTDGAKITTPIVLGTEIRLVFTMLSGAGFPDFRLSKCMANNAVANLTDSSYREIEFLQEGCPSDDAKAIFNKVPEKSTPVSNTSAIVITVSVKAFMFVGSSQKVAFVCYITFCRDSAIDNCKQPVCPGFSASDKSSVDDSPGDVTESPGNGTSVVRRKRDAAGSKTLRGEVTVYDAATQVKEIKETLANNKKMNCIEQPNIMAVVIILALVAVVLLAILVVLVYRQTRRKNKVSANNMGYDPDHMPVHTMRIPRLEVNTNHNEAC